MPTGDHHQKTGIGDGIECCVGVRPHLRHGRELAEFGGSHASTMATASGFISRGPRLPEPGQGDLVVSHLEKRLKRHVEGLPYASRLTGENIHAAFDRGPALTVDLPMRLAARRRIASASVPNMTARRTRIGEPRPDSGTTPPATSHSGPGEAVIRGQSCDHPGGM